MLMMIQQKAKILMKMILRLFSKIHSDSFLKYEKFVDQHFMNDGVYANTTFVNNVQDRFPSCAKKYFFNSFLKIMKIT